MIGEAFVESLGRFGLFARRQPRTHHRSRSTDEPDDGECARLKTVKTSLQVDKFCGMMVPAAVSSPTPSEASTPHPSLQVRADMTGSGAQIFAACPFNLDKGCSKIGIPNRIDPCAKPMDRAGRKRLHCGFGGPVDLAHSCKTGSGWSTRWWRHHRFGDQAKVSAATDVANMQGRGPSPCAYDSGQERPACRNVSRSTELLPQATVAINERDDRP